MSEPRIFHGLHDLDRKMLRFIDFDGGYFVEVGANDGVAQSNTLYYERCRGWHGVLVEPSHANYFKCRASRSPASRIFCAVPRPLNDILIEAGSPASIDFFSLDVEGNELQVLEGVDHDRFRFRHLLVECRSLSRMARYLEAHGYRYHEPLSDHDHLFADARIA